MLPRGLDRLSVRIAGITVTIHSRDPDLKLWAPEATNDFLVEEAEPDARVLARWGDCSEERPGEEVFDSGGLWRLHRHQGAYHFRFTSPALAAHPYKVASFHPDFTSGEVHLHRSLFTPGRPVWPLEYPLEELLIVNLLGMGRGVEVHACGLMTAEGEGFLFVGPSGAGKTTMARLWRREVGVRVLSDDRVILRKVDGRLLMYGTPWHGEARLSSPAGAELTRIFFLRHGPRNEVVPQEITQAVARLFASSFPPFHSPSGLEFSLRLLDEVASSVPSHELVFVPDGSVVGFVGEAR